MSIALRLCLLGCLFVAIHVGFRAPHGQLGWWLLLLTVWSTAFSSGTP